MSQTQCSGIILSSTKLFEYDQRIEILTEKQGKISCLAKYAYSKRSKSNILGALQIINEVNLTLIKGKSFYIIKSCELRQSFPKIRTCFNKISLGSYVLDIIRKSTLQNQQNQELLSLTINTMKNIEKSNNITQLKAAFEKSFLEGEGLQPNRDNKKEVPFEQVFEIYTNKKVHQPLFI